MPSALEGILEPTLTGLGYELVDMQVSNRGRFLRLFMDKPGGITVEDCAAVSRHLSRVFEVEGIDYDRLEVSSPGLDRVLRTQDHFARFAGERVKVEMIAQINGRKRFQGRLQKVGESEITLEMDGGEVTLPIDDIHRARLVPDV